MFIFDFISKLVTNKEAPKLEPPLIVLGFELLEGDQFILFLLSNRVQSIALSFISSLYRHG